MQWKVHKNKKVYDGHFSVGLYEITHEKFSGDTTPKLHRELVGRNDAVALLPYDPVTDELVFVEQFRMGALREEQPWIKEIVAGLIDENESIEEVAYREAEEEIGCVPSEIIKIGGFYTSPGGLSEWVDLFIGKISIGELDNNGGIEAEGEDIRVFKTSASEALNMIESGEIKSAIAIIALQWFAIHKEKIQKQWLD
ncbi:MAG: NUDIX domain-containing protein [Pseudomonadota bacterium]